MNEVVPDWLHHEDTTRAVPNLSTNAEHPASTMESQLWEQLREVKEENLALRADMAKLEAENVELRKKFMTNMERIQTADKHTLASYLYEIYTLGPYVQAAGADDPTSIAFDSVDYKRDGGTDLTPIIQWLDRTEWD